MRPEAKEKLKDVGRELGNVAMKETATLAREELPGLLSRFVQWVKRRRASRRAKR
jgi:hypothetical protein